MIVLGAADIDAALTFPTLIPALEEAFSSDIVVPVRHHHAIDRTDGGAMHLLMPAWSKDAGGYLGVKAVNVFPGNAARGLPSVMGSYLLMQGDTGVPLAVMDGTRLTLWRTAAASALASRVLSRPDCATMLMIGAGALSPFLISAHAAVRPLKRVMIWNRDRVRSARLVTDFTLPGVMLEAVEDLPAALRQADLISAATMSEVPLVTGADLKPGTHVDLVGAYKPVMRESDDATIKRARIFVDTRAAALKEAGDIVQAVASGALDPLRIEADLFDLCRGQNIVRDGQDITLFKSVGSAVEDLAAAKMVYERHRGSSL